MKAFTLAGLLAIAIGATGCSTSNHFVYVVGTGTNSVFAFQQTPAGKLVEVTAPAATTDSLPVSIVIHPSGKFIYVANSAGNNVTLLATSGKGTLAVPKDPITNNALGPFTAGTGPVALAVAPGGQFLYVLNGGSSNISVFTIDTSTGNLSALKTSPFGTPASPVSIAIAGNGKFLYVANPALGTVSGFTIGSDGSLAAITGSPFTTGGAPSWVVIDSSSKFLYVADTTGNQILGFSVDANSGAPTPITGSPFATGSQPVSLAIDSNSGVLVAANRGSNNISVYAVN